MTTAADGSGELEAFWRVARRRARLETLPGYFGPGPLASVPPPAWAFGADPEQADRLLQLVLAGTKTATASAYDDYDADDPVPEPGALSVLLDGAGHPRALIVTTAVEVVPFDQVGADHAYAEGEGDRTLATWRADHEEFFRTHDPGGRGFRPDLAVVLERFRVLYQS